LSPWVDVLWGAAVGSGEDLCRELIDEVVSAQSVAEIGVCGELTVNQLSEGSWKEAAGVVRGCAVAGRLGEGECSRVTGCRCGGGRVEPDRHGRGQRSGALVVSRSMRRVSRSVPSLRTIALLQAGSRVRRL
jgi:hypothetical protein